MMRQRRPLLESPLKLIVIGCLLLLAAAAALAFVERNMLVAELEQESNILHRLVSQRADQHDAHMTALSAVATAGEGERRDLFLDVAATISRFYPRIDEVQLVPLDPQGMVVGTETLDPALAEIVRAAAKASDGSIAILPHPGKPHHYIMVKRSPNSDAARYGLMLGIDAEKLLDEAGAFWTRPGVDLALSLPDGRPLFNRGEAGETLRFSRVLGSASQPLLLETGMQIGLADLFPPLVTGLVLLATALAYLAVLSALRQRARTRQAVEQARLSALDSRLAHASRVNALGEMASGLAHELTQPLTAILAQVQAGRRLLGRGDVEALAPVLDDTVTQARRASAILERFRNWSRPQDGLKKSAFDMRDAVRNVEALLAPQAGASGMKLALDLPMRAVPVIADPVEMEQVVFNLVRNAIDATAAQDEKTLHVSVGDDGKGNSIVTVTDNGPGISGEALDKLFQPFFTTKPEGMGVGLSISRTIIEAHGGHLRASNTDGGGARFEILLPTFKQQRA